MKDTDDLDEIAGKMREENERSFDSMLEALRQAGMLIEPTPAECEAYLEKHFPPGKIVGFDGGHADSKDCGFHEPHTLDPLADDLESEM